MKKKKERKKKNVLNQQEESTFVTGMSKIMMIYDLEITDLACHFFKMKQKIDMNMKIRLKKMKNEGDNFLDCDTRPFMKIMATSRTICSYSLH